MDRYWLLTWTTYGTWLPGDKRGFVSRVRARDGSKRRHNVPQTPYDSDIEPMHSFSRDVLKGEAALLTAPQAGVVLRQLQETAAIRGWRLLAVAVMANHVHLVVGVAEDPDPATLLRDFKSYTSGALSCEWGKPSSGKWWTASGSRRKLPDDQAVVAAIWYVREQERPLVTWVASDARL